MKIIRADQHKIMTWKNGLGRTDEILIEPAGAGLDDFDLRLSMAHVRSDGPFSLFEGIDRTLTVLSGGTMDLTIDNTRTVTLAPGSQPFPFSGEALVEAKISAPLIDLNVMTRRPALSHAVRRQDLAGQITINGGQGRMLIFVTDECSIEAGGETIPMAAHDTAVIQPDARVTLTGTKGSAFLIEIQKADRRRD